MVTAGPCERATFGSALDAYVCGLHISGVPAVAIRRPNDPNSIAQEPMTFPKWRHAVVVSALFACSGDDTTAPRTYAAPAVGGTYTISILFNNLTASVANGTGVLTLNQPSRDVITLTGSAQIVLTLAGTATTVTEIRDAQATSDSIVIFRVIVPNAASTWMFQGRLASSGQFLSGTHTLTNPSSPAPTQGTWTATKQ